MRGKFLSLFISSLLIFSISTTTYAEPIDNSENYKKLEELKKELKEERNVKDQQRLEEIRLKELEKKQNNPEIEETTKPEIKNNNSIKEQSDIIPNLIVRLRGKHSRKYLCEYSFIEKNNNTENSISKVIIDDYDTLLKKPSLKVRPGETINFEFSEKPQKITTYIYNDTNNEVVLKNNCIKVPTIDKKIIVIIEGSYATGYIKYAIVLDIRN